MPVKTLPYDKTKSEAQMNKNIKLDVKYVEETLEKFPLKSAQWIAILDNMGSIPTATTGPSKGVLIFFYSAKNAFFITLSTIRIDRNKIVFWICFRRKKIIISLKILVFF